jgi:hypothetical protein
LNSYHQWAVVGAGPAGIAALGKLLDEGVAPEEILWLDPYFQVGDLGRCWSQVSSNTRVRLFLKFLLAIDSFEYATAKVDFHINQLDPEQTCLLSQIVEPLQWITDRLVQKVQSQATTVQRLKLAQGLWTLSTEHQDFHAEQVILATGAIPSVLEHPGIQTLPFEQAIDKQKLEAQVDLNQTYAVFGASHSAVIILKNLVELGVKQVVNFYRGPCKYALEMGDWILFDNTGLKGESARWARKYIDGRLPPNLVRYTSDPGHVAQYLPQCDKVIYAIGFEKRRSLLLGDSKEIQHNPYLGIIGPGLFGLGIGYPELKADPFGNVESQVGLWKFMVYLNKVMPIWFQYGTNPDKIPNFLED